MNNKDCEMIGYILSHAYEYDNIRDLIDELIKIDKRIEEEFLSFSENRLRNEKIEELRDKKLLEKFGRSYPILKACGIDEYRKAYEEAKNEIDDIDN